MAALMIFVSGHAMACPLCSSILQLTISAQELVYSRHAVLAAPVADRNAYRVVAVIKGEAPAGNTIPGPVFRGVMKSEKPLLLIRDVAWPRWVNFGPVSADQADWLRKLTATKSANDLTDEEWREHVAFFLPYLENPEPMVAEIAFNEFASAPYAALRSLKPRLDAVALRKWLADPRLAAREPVYLLLLGIAGTADDARWIEERIATVRQKHDSAKLPALLGAQLELRGPAGIEQIETLYLADSTRTEPELEAAVAALNVYASSHGGAARGRVNEALRLLNKQRPAPESSSR
jgi:hypothetical protein